ncbi:MAG: hypothetical protein VR72_07980 [Clostridiaceae bacterium BRH_c20a]|nr:MAG: hypothetical protein VR72_07980 [Clostridiaceae bacterium BRH_c20a]
MFQLQECPTFTQDHWEPDYGLPDKYGETFIVLMIRDPQNIFAYWEVTEKKVNEIVAEYGEDNLKGSNLAVRLSWPDHKEIIVVNDHTESWYFSLGNWGIPLFGELGRILADNTFITLAVSNRLNSYISLNFLSKKSLDNTLQRTLDKWQPGVSS